MQANAEIEQMCADMDAQAAAAQAERVNSALDRLDSHILMLKGLGVNVSVNLEAPTTRPWDKIEQPGSVKAPGWYAYVDFMDEEGTKRRIDAARAAAEYARRE